jgi:hypothetical protein
MVIDALASSDADRAEQAIQLHVRAESVVEALRAQNQQEKVQLAHTPRRKARR